jgi:hypothetical protein
LLTVQRRSGQWIGAHPEVALIAVAAVVRVAYLFLAGGVSVHSGDAGIYLGIARSLADGSPTTNGYPLQALYSVLLSPAYILDVSISTSCCTGWPA